MGRGVWQSVQNSKSFYVRSYRRVSFMAMISLLLNLILGCGIYYSYFNQPPRQYYATSGVTPPVRLTPRNAPNDSSTALLPPDPVNTEEAKVIPQ